MQKFHKMSHSKNQASTNGFINESVTGKHAEACHSVLSNNIIPASRDGNSEVNIFIPRYIARFVCLPFNGL